MIAAAHRTHSQGYNVASSSRDKSTAVERGTVLEHVPALFCNKAPNSCILFLPAALSGATQKPASYNAHSVTTKRIVPLTGARWK
ncbi:hypothetical protein PAMP_005827 [Pampus punctatissimus]